MDFMHEKSRLYAASMRNLQQLDEFIARFSDEHGLRHEEYYPVYLGSEEWGRVRDEVLKRDGYRCRLCGTGKNLYVHHVNYAPKGYPDKEECLITLCRSCHKRVHSADLAVLIEYQEE